MQVERVFDPVLDTMAIESLMLAYCELVDEARVDELGALFADDALLDSGAGQQVIGRADTVEFVSGRLRIYRATSHHLSNIRVTATGPDSAAVTSHIYAWHERPDGTQLEIWGRYLDEVERSSDGWVISVRHIRAAGARGINLPPGQHAPFEQTPRRTVS